MDEYASKPVAHKIIQHYFAMSSYTVFKQSLSEINCFAQLRAIS